MKYQVVEISKYLINIKDYKTANEAVTQFQTSIQDAKELPILNIEKVYLTIENGIAAKWENEELKSTGSKPG